MCANARNDQKCAIIETSGCRTGVSPHVFFPANAIVSLLYVMEDGSSAEIAVLGNERIVDVSADTRWTIAHSYTGALI